MSRIVVLAVLSIFAMSLAALQFTAPAQACGTNACVDSPPPAKPKGD